MDTGRIIPGQSQPPAQLPGAQAKSGEEAFHDMAESKGYDKEAVDQAVRQRTGLSRTKKGDSTKRKHSSLFLVKDDSNLEEERPYITLIVDGERVTLRHICYA